MKYEFAFGRKNPVVHAVFWDGVNREPVERFAATYLPADGESNVIRWYHDEWLEEIERLREDGKPESWAGPDYNMIKFGSCGGLEADPNFWIVVNSHGELETWTDYAFREEFHVPD